jgi:ubiquinone/menaquinone biosynthesis C-methylase UbiE
MSNRVDREQVFHDEIAKSIQLDELLVHESFESPTAIENRHILQQMGSLRGKKLLDIGCGSGETSVYFALQGAEVSACDISCEMLQLGTQMAEKYKVKINFFQADASCLPLASDYFDFVFGNGVLHHVDLEKSPKEIYRVLKTGGSAYFVEPLPYNPVINVYRKMAAAVRTEDEKPLTLKQIKGLGQHFSTLQHEEFWLFSLLIFLHFFFIRRWHPSKVRYWKKVIEEGNHYKTLFGRLNRFDCWAMKVMPFLRPLCWNTVISVRK